VTTIHVRYETLDDPGRPDPESAPDSFAWGVQAVGLPGNLSAFGVGDALDEALDDLAEGIRALFSAGSVPDELTPGRDARIDLPPGRPYRERTARPSLG
jgi:hypothetical protein